MATLDVDNASLGGLRSDLETFFGGEYANAEVMVNPTHVPPEGGCVTGHGHACLILRDLNGGNTITPYNTHALPPRVDSAQVSPNPLNLLTLATIGQELDKGLASQLATYLPDEDNVRLLVKVDAAHAYLGNRAGATGVWLPLVIQTESPASRLHHCGDNLDTLPGDTCKDAVKAAKDHGCNAVSIKVKLKRIHIYLGFIPSKSDQCDPYGPNLATEWMRFIPLGHDFDQPCLSVTTDVAGAVELSAFGKGGDAEIEASPEDCNSGTNLACATVVDCVEKATNGAIPIAQQQIDSTLGTLESTLAPYFNSDGHLYDYGIAPFGSGPCAATDAECWLPLLSASLAEVSYGWFANPFLNLDYTKRHYPVVDVRSSLTCPDGHTPSLSDTGPAECHICDFAYGGPCDYDAPYDSATGSCDCGLAFAPAHTVSPTADLYFDYAVDTDGDGVPNLDDNCPDTQNAYPYTPADSQTDSDADGIGDACDTCPHSAVTPENDADGDCVADSVDNCPDDANPDQTNCNFHAEGELGIPHRGDACDPYPCAGASTRTTGLIDQFSPTCSKLSNKPKDCTEGDYVSEQVIEWRGVQAAGAATATGQTRFAHCNCGATGDLDTRAQNCRFGAQGQPLCTIASHTSYPGANGTSNTSGWVSESTQPLDDYSCVQAGNCPIQRNVEVASTYAYDAATADLHSALWRFDQDLDLLGASNVKNEQQLIAAAPGFNGLGWAETPQLGSKLLDSQPLPPGDAKISTKPNARQSDAASHYFIQDPGIISSAILNLGELSCPPGGCGFDITSIVDRPCLTCGKNDFGSWLFKDGSVIVQMSQGLALDETAKLDAGLVTMLEDPTHVLVPVSEPVDMLREQGYFARAFWVDRQTMNVNGVVAALRGGLVGINYQFTDYDPPPTDVLAASAVQNRVYGVAGGAAGEQLIILRPDIVPIGGTPPAPTVLPLSGIDAGGVPLSLVYRVQDAQLYLLDKVVHHGNSSRLRLLRVTVTGGYATVAASTAEFAAGSDAYLSAMPSGDLLLAESRKSGSTRFTTLHPTRDSVEVTGSLVQQGTLMAPPDSRTAAGISVVMRHRAKGPIQVLEIPWSYLAQPGKAHQLPPRWE